MPLSLVLRPAEAGEHLEIDTDETTMKRVLGFVLSSLVAPSPPVRQAPAPLPKTTPAKAKSRPAARPSKHGHKLVHDLVCQWCSSIFSGREGQRYCGREHALKANLLQKKGTNPFTPPRVNDLLPEAARTAPAAPLPSSPRTNGA
jgi:hypothetical protein